MIKILKLNNLILPFVTAISLSLLLIESITYPGFISKHIMINANLIVMINVLQMAIYIFGKKEFDKEKHNNKLQNLIFNLSFLLLPVFIIIYFLLVSLETKNYPNYVYSTIHVNLDAFFKAITLQSLVVFFGVISLVKFKALSFKLKGNKINLKLRANKNLITLFFLIFLSYQLIFSFFDTVQILFKNNVYILNNLYDSYDQKMYKSWHFFYRYMTFIVENTPKDAKIAIPPPVRPWLSEGNSVLVRYFLYPRYLVTIENERKEEYEPDYYLITKGLWKAYNQEEYGWPKEKIVASEIIYFDPDNFTTKIEKNIVFDPDAEKNKYGWGLIKVNKDKS